MKRNISLFCILLAWSAAAQAPAPARPTDAELTRRIDAYIAPLAAHELSGTLLVARGDRILLERSFGFANYELHVPFTASTPTNVASITKPMTIIITSILAEQHKLGVNDTVSKWLPEFVYGPRITITQLLNHRGGIPHRLLPEDQQTEPKTASDMVLAANAMPLLFEPGSQSVYSSGGYAVLAAVLERVTGKSYDAMLQEMVVKPVGAQFTRHADQRSLLEGRASPAIPTNDGVLNAPFRDLSFLVGAGSVYSTPHDLFLIAQGVLTNKYGAAARSALLRPTGFAWNGVTNGFRAFADYRVSDSLTVIFAGNTHTGAIDLLRRKIPEMATGNTVAPADVPKVAAVALSPAARSRLSGAYDTGGGSTGTLTFISPTLALFGDRALLAINDSTLYSFADYARVTFKSNASGGVEGIEWGVGTWGTEAGPKFARIKENANSSGLTTVP